MVFVSLCYVLLFIGQKTESMCRFSLVYKPSLLIEEFTFCLESESKCYS